MGKNTNFVFKLYESALNRSALEELIKISQQYESIRKKSFDASEMYFSENDVHDLIKDTNSGKIPKYKQLENEGDFKVKEFVEFANNYCKKKEIDQRELVDQIISFIIEEEEKETINLFLLINFMWSKKKVENNFNLEGIDKILRYLLKPNLIDSRKIYYIESFIDIWRYDTDELIPIEILEEIIIKEQKGEYSYGALIKASSYLKDHPKEKLLKAKERIQNTERYKADDYFREWIN